MIYTVTFNPSLDYVVKAPGFAIGEINRTEDEVIYPGGKGVNVSLMLGNLGLSSRTLGFIAGFSGAELERRVQEAGCISDFIKLDKGYTRINVKISGKPETALNGQGPQLTKEHLALLLHKLADLQAGDILVLAGSIPKTMPDDAYEQIMCLLDGRGIKTVVDATGELVLKVLKYRPFLIKPNHAELGEFFGKGELHDVEEIIACAKRLQELGARNVLVSRAADGAVLLDEEGKVHCCAAPKGVLVNSVGAGDSMVAGFLAGFLENGSYEQALRLGLCAGSASAFSDWLATREQIDKLLVALPQSL